MISSSVGQTGEIMIDSQWKLDPQKMTEIKQVCLLLLHVWFRLTDWTHLWTTNIITSWSDANCKDLPLHLHFKSKIQKKKATQKKTLMIWPHLLCSDFYVHRFYTDNLHKRNKLICLWSTHSAEPLTGRSQNSQGAKYCVTWQWRQ